MKRPTERAKVAHRVFATLLLGTVLLLSSCRSASSPTGGETHFLRTCSADPACGDGLSCVCGACTRSCTSSADCSGLTLARCVAPAEPSACSDTGARCEVVCNVDADCRALSEAHRCVLNVCRAGTNSPDGGMTTCEQGTVAANEVLVIGDSFFALSHQVTAYLEELARKAGALGAGERYRDNSNTTTNALAMGGNGILEQYRRGVAEAPVEVVIMNGGGTDMLVTACSAPVDECPALVDAAAAAEVLLGEMAADGVSDVVYAFYPDPTDPEMLERMDALRRLIEPVCAASPVPCHWVDLRATLGASPDYMSADGLIPTALGSEASAGAIWSTMQEECIAQ